MKFMHFSDVHLGVRPDQGKPWSEKRAKDIWNSFAETMNIAVKEQPQYLFITGDLFHGQPLKKELKEICYFFEKLPDTKIILMAGNHDYMQQKSYYRTMEWPGNVYFFMGEEVSQFDFPEDNVAVYGLSYWHREVREKKYDTVVPMNPNRINILCIHGGDERHIPFSPEKIMNHGFDYIAAGHIHKGSQMIPGRAVMAGALEPTDCNDTGSHGYWIGTIDKKGTNVSFFPIKKCEYCQETMKITSDMTMYSIMEWVQSLLQERPDYQYFRITLQGYKNPDVAYDFTEIEELDRIVDVTEQLVLDYDYEKLLQENKETLLGNYIFTMRQGEQTSVERKALEYGVNALLGHQICR